MNGRLAIKSVLAFCAALLAGRLLFPASSISEPAAPIAAVDESSSAPISVVSSPAQPAPAQQTSAAPAMFRDTPINREFQPVPGGLRNDNARMSHFIASEYSKGTIHRAINQFGANMEWVPLAQEIWSNGKPVSSVKHNNSAKAEAPSTHPAGRVSFADTYPETDDHMSIRPDGGLEHDMVLRRLPQGVSPAQDLAFSGTITLSKDLTLWDGKTQITGDYSTRNGINLKNKLDNTVIYLRRPVAFDASVTAADGSLDKVKQAKPEFRNGLIGCTYDFKFTKDGIQLSVVTPGSWLSAPERAFPLTVDPNIGPFGLADGNPPIYVGAVGSNTLLPASFGGTLIPIVETCAQFGLPDQGYGIIPMPFGFDYYGIVHPAGSPLFVHIDGFATWFATAPVPLEPQGFITTCDDLTPAKTGNGDIPDGQYPLDGFFPYWDDLRFSSDPTSGIYFFVSGDAPNRRLVIEWHKMRYALPPTGDVISFNLILSECDSKIELIILQPNEVDRQSATTGIENPDGSLGIRYSFNDITTGTAPLSVNTSLNFERSKVGFIGVANTELAGCIPHTVCFDSTITTITSPCQIGPSLPPSFAFHWIFDSGRLPNQKLDPAEAFTEDVCHTFTKPGVYQISLDVTDEFGSTFNLLDNLQVLACDRPGVLIAATPQGGVAPLLVEVEARSVSETVNVGASVTFLYDRLGAENQPGVFTRIGLANANLVQGIAKTQARFDQPGIYRIRALVGGTDVATLQGTLGVGTLYVFVNSPTESVGGSMMVTESGFSIDWIGKLDGPDPDGLPPNINSTVPGDGLPDSPFNDSIGFKGIVNIPGVTLAQLAGKPVQVSINGYDTIFNGFIDNNGVALSGGEIEGDGRGQFNIALPSGKFSITVRGRDLYQSLGLTGNKDPLRQLVTTQVKLVIGDIFIGNALLTYDYQASTNTKRSIANQNGSNLGAPILASAKATYKFGKFYDYNNFDNAPFQGFGQPNGQTILASGGFLVTDAKFNLQGNTVTVAIKGLLARFGGDDLRPSGDSDVVVTIGGFSETLNFTTTPTFKTTGRPPSQKLSFKRSSALGKTGIASLKWTNPSGLFEIKTFGIPNELVGLKTDQALQLINVGLTLTPENGQVFQATTTFDVTKTSDTLYTRK